jgi:predicted N-acetyltransferase YhbS
MRPNGNEKSKDGIVLEKKPFGKGSLEGELALSETKGVQPGEVH